MVTRSLVMVFILAFVALLTAFAIIASTHRVRAAYAELQTLEGQRWYLEEEYSRLLLEEGTWSSHHRVAAEAGSVLDLVTPSAQQLRLVKP
ncbi:MAG: cell division protein FtsL [Halieaceae bacterium]|jgi:cell division protein FtsL|nr:cell division protein FtsL [Halieaceae bacterium]